MPGYRFLRFGINGLRTAEMFMQHALTAFALAAPLYFKRTAWSANSGRLPVAHSSRNTFCAVGGLRAVIGRSKATPKICQAPDNPESSPNPYKHWRFIFPNPGIITPGNLLK
jgi:hypothetical protein